MRACVCIGDLSRAVRSLNTTRFGVYHSLYEWFNPLWLQDKQSNLTTRNFVTDKVLPELYELVNRELDPLSIVICMRMLPDRNVLKTLLYTAGE